MIRYLTFLFSFTVMIMQLQAQNACTYQLILNDSAGNGWQGAGVVFYAAGATTTETINGATDTVDIAVVDGDSISIEYVSAGMGDAQNNFQLLDSDGQVLINVTNPSAGVSFEGFAICPDCPAIVLNSIVNVDSFDNRILIDWVASDSLGIYQIEYAPCGFLEIPDSVSVVMSSISEATIPNLEENSCYEYRIALTCLSGSQSIFSGPHIGHTIFSTDVGISDVLAPRVGNKCTFTSEDTLFVFLKNYGAIPQTFVPFDFIIEKDFETQGMVNIPVDGLYTGILVKDSCVAFPFETPIDVSDPGVYTITTWTALSGDGDVSNDTFSYTFSHSSLLPFFEDFSDNELPNRWSSDEGNPILSGIISSDLGPLNSRFTLSTERYGYITETDSLAFDYYFTDIMGTNVPANLTAGDQLQIEVSRDCGASYDILDILDVSNFDLSISTLREHKVSLANYAGDIVSFRFVALRGGSSFRILLDNINVYECGVNSELILDDLVINTAEVTEETGSIIVNPIGGAGPYNFMWSTGFTEVGEISSIDNLGAGLYSVTVTDTRSASCFTSESYSIGVVSTQQLVDVADIQMYPNPVQDMLTIDIQMEQAQALDVRIFNVMGQELWSKNLDIARSHQELIPTSGFDIGMYFIQFSSANGQLTERFIKEN